VNSLGTIIRALSVPLDLLLVSVFQSLIPAPPVGSSYMRILSLLGSSLSLQVIDLPTAYLL